MDQNKPYEYPDFRQYDIYDLGNEYPIHKNGQEILCASNPNDADTIFWLHYQLGIAKAALNAIIRDDTQPANSNHIAIAMCAMVELHNSDECLIPDRWVKIE
jgi:hypothetical protein